jgi:hypothetical protein
MTTDFDPYYKWLGIPPKDQPPHHYRLLGIELFETDREVIDAAANRLMGYLKDLAVGDEGAHSQRLLNEIARARLCLLNKKKKAGYDDQLRQQLQSEGTLEQETRKPAVKGPPPKASKRSVPPPAVPPSGPIPPATTETPGFPAPPDRSKSPMDAVKIDTLDKQSRKSGKSDSVKIAVDGGGQPRRESAVVKSGPGETSLQGRGVLIAFIVIAAVGMIGLALIIIMTILLLTT